MKSLFIILVLTFNATLILAQEFDVAKQPYQIRIGVGIMLTEQFKSIKGYEGLYEVSNLGRVRSSDRFSRNRHSGYIRKGKILKPCLSKRGYFAVSLHGKDKIQIRNIHILVWDHFGNKSHSGGRLQIDHIDGNRLHNQIDNLQLLTNRENCSKGHKQGGKVLPTGVYHSKDKYKSQIMYNDKLIYLGRYDNTQEAESAYQNKLKEILGKENDI